MGMLCMKNTQTRKTNLVNVPDTFLSLHTTYNDLVRVKETFQVRTFDELMKKLLRYRILPRKRGRTREYSRDLVSSERLLKTLTAVNLSLSGEIREYEADTNFLTEQRPVLEAP